MAAICRRAYSLGEWNRILCVVTSGTRSPLLRKNIALCRMAIEYAAAGTQVEIGKLDGQQKRIAARVVRIPFYDPERTRLRG